MLARNLRYVYYNFTEKGTGHCMQPSKKLLCIYNTDSKGCHLFCVNMERAILLLTIRDSNLYVYFTSA